MGDGPCYHCCHLGFTFGKAANTHNTVKLYTQIQEYTRYTNTRIHQIHKYANVLACTQAHQLSMPLSPLPSLHFVEFHNKSSQSIIFLSPPTTFCNLQCFSDLLYFHFYFCHHQQNSANFFPAFPVLCTFWSCDVFTVHSACHE